MNVQSTDPGLRFSDDDENMMMEDPEAQELDADFGSLAKPPSFFCIPEYRRQLIISIVFFSSGLGLIIYAMANFAWENSTFGLVALLLGVLLTLPGGYEAWELRKSYQKSKGYSVHQVAMESMDSP